jgi:hypothetical protein
MSGAQLPLYEHRGAAFSTCRRYRFTLTRIWSRGGRGNVNFIMLNPSTADEAANDPTVERCERRARAWGFDSLRVTNLFAFRATAPEQMLNETDPVGAENDFAIVGAAWDARLVVCAWGTHGTHRARAAEMVKLLRGVDVQLHALKLTANGQPAHPLYLPYSLQPFALGADALDALQAASAQLGEAKVRAPRLRDPARFEGRSKRG